MESPSIPPEPNVMNQDGSVDDDLARLQLSKQPVSSTQLVAECDEILTKLKSLITEPGDGVSFSSSNNSPAQTPPVIPPAAQPVTFRSPSTSSTSSARSNSNSIRYRTRECFPEAFDYAVNSILQSGVPLWFAQWLGGRIAGEIYPYINEPELSQIESSDEDENEHGHKQQNNSSSTSRSSSLEDAGGGSPRHNIPKRVNALLATYIKEIEQQAELWKKQAASRSSDDKNNPFSRHSTAAAANSAQNEDSSSSSSTSSSLPQAPPQSSLSNHNNNDNNNGGKATSTINDKNGKTSSADVVVVKNGQAQHRIENFFMDAKPATLNGKYSWSIFTAKNTRRKMEDRHCIVPAISLIYPNTSHGSDLYCGVFDGHGGMECASYLSVHLLDHIVRAPAFSTSVPKALSTAFTTCDQWLLKRCAKQHYRSGSTGVVGYIRDGKCTVGWTGDSQAAVIRVNGQSDLVTLPVHSPDEPGEFKRIEERGGSIMSIDGELRVMGCLNLTRSFGDASLKPDEIIIADCDVAEFDVNTGEEDMIIFGCDGIWDHVTVHEVLFTFKQYMHEHPPSEQAGLSALLGKLARNNMSSDNMTAIILFLRPVQEVWQRFLNADHIIQEQHPTTSEGEDEEEG